MSCLFNCRVEVLHRWMNHLRSLRVSAWNITTYRLDGHTTLSENLNEIYILLGSYVFDNLYSNYNSVSFYHLNLKKLKFEETMQTRDIKIIYVSDANVKYKL